MGDIGEGERRRRIYVIPEGEPVRPAAPEPDRTPAPSREPAREPQPA